jgi:tight adherence protein B
MLALRPAGVAAFDSAAGVTVLAAGGAACVTAYRLMIRIGRLPAQPRVLK